MVSAVGVHHSRALAWPVVWAGSVPAVS